MRIGTLVTTVLVSVVALSSAQDRDRKSGNPKLKSSASFGNSGGNIKLCSDDCSSGSYAKLNLARLYEVDPTGKDASNKAENFNKADGVWSAPVSSSRDGVNTTTYTYSTVVAVGKPKDAKTAQFNMTAVVYDTNGTAWNGNQTVNVAAGAIKFSISLGPWPFLADTNKLRFGVRVETKSKNETTPKSKGEKHEGKRDPKNGKIDRMDLGDTMYLDSPAQAVVDGANVEIWSNVDASPDGAIVQWEFPHYTNTLYYDPVLGSTDPTVTETGATITTSVPSTTTSAPTTTTAPPPTTTTAALMTTPQPSATGAVSISFAAIAALSAATLAAIV